MPALPFLLYSAKVEGSIWRQVQCEKCGADYVFPVSATGRGEGIAPLGMGRSAARYDAASEAQWRLERELVEKIEPVPCPGCRHYQSDMVWWMRTQRLTWMRIVAVLFFTVATFTLSGALVAVFNPNAAWFGGTPMEALLLALATAVLAFLGAAMLLLRTRSINRFDPNTETSAADRIYEASEKAMLLEKFRERYPNALVFPQC